MKRNGILAAVVAVVVGGFWSGGAVFGSAQYTLIDLGPGSAEGINDAGQVVGLSGTNSLQAFIYSNGVETVFGTALGSNSRAASINASGVAAGTYNNGDGHGFTRQSNGMVMTLPLLDAYGINNSGVVVGDHINGSVVDAATYSGGMVTDFGTLGGNSSVAWGISNMGVVVGQSRDSSGNDHAVEWQTGNLTILSSKPYSSAHGVNSSGQVVGADLFFSAGSDSVSHATIWQNGTSTDLTPTNVTGSLAYGINDAGTIVGYDGFATIWQNGVEQNLNNLIAAGSGLTLYNAYSINNGGQIVGDGETPSGVEHAYLLTPIATPEPGAGLVLGIGCAGLLLTRR